MSKLLIKLALGIVFFIGLGWMLAPYFMGAKPLNPVVLQAGGITVYWYGLLMVIAILAGYWLVARYLARARGISREHLLNIVIWVLVGGLIGARAMFVILKWPLYADSLSEIWLFTHGGLSIHGAVLGGALALWWYARSAKLNFFALADVLVPGLILGQAIGRFGNFTNQEAFGGPTQLPWKMFITPMFRPEGLEAAAYFHPTFLYESIGALIILAILLYLFYRHRFSGYVLAWYLILYSSLRFVIEYVRIDSDTWGVLTVAQWASLAIIVLGLYLLYRRRYA